MNRSLIVLFTLILSAAFSIAQNNTGGNTLAPHHLIIEGKGYDSLVLVGKSENELKDIFKDELDTLHCNRCKVLYKDKNYKYVDYNRNLEFTIDSNDKVHRITFKEEGYATSQGVKIGEHSPINLDELASDISYSLDSFQIDYLPKYGMDILEHKLVVKSITIYPKDSLLYRELPVGRMKKYYLDRRLSDLDSIQISGTVIDYSSGFAGEDVDREIMVFNVLNAPPTFKDKYILIQNNNADKNMQYKGKSFNVTITPRPRPQEPEITYFPFKDLGYKKYYCISIHEIKAK
jgi:hypothetical protein